MIVTLEEAQTKLVQIVGRATAGEDVFIAAAGGMSAIKLVPVVMNGSRLTQHPDLIGSTKVLDQEALTKPLPPEDWGGLAER
jgi:antitoxin (DNA-binding transcriptional repressor) of toxin-antitoxin stability system